MTTYPNMSLVLPTRGPSGSGLWGNTLDADLALLDAHDHSSGKGLQIPTAGLNINADLSFSSLYAPKNLHRLQFSEIAGGSLVGANNLSLFVSDGTGGLTAHELYFRTSAGNNIKFTSGSSLNVGAFVGGIGGDYTSVSALLSFDDANKQYKHLVGGGTNWAHGSFGGIRLLEFNTSETVYVEQLCPAGLGSSYSMTWPTALPASQESVSVDSAGQLVFGDKHGDRVLTMAGMAGIVRSGTVTFDVDGSLHSTAATDWQFQFDMRLGDRVKTLTYAEFGDGAVDISSAQVFKVTKGGAATSIGLTSYLNVAAAWADRTIDITDTTITDGDIIIFRIQVSGTGYLINNLRMTYDHP